MTENNGITFTSQYDGAYTPPVYGVRVNTDDVNKDDIKPFDINLVAEAMGAKEIIHITWEWKRPARLWRTLAHVLPRRWCGEYVSSSPCIAATLVKGGTRA